MRRRVLAISLTELLPAPTDPWSRELAFFAPPAVAAHTQARHLTLVPPPADTDRPGTLARRRKDVLKTALTLS